MYTHELTPIEIECGVTLDDVARELPRGAFREDGSVFVVSRDTAPAVAFSTARAAFGGVSVDYIGRTRLGIAYERA